ncbi:uncharacterized protein BDZ99DRAFT_531435 [Mytilinidion resinicola]|uniref:Uncharacterized protein n=1 Tax=Mytilinidion resinicola TaxID=574789 RepID=A0A6A6YLA5_9PEZI|nr:uncharacterized protein BDZ99DRAFT_531435 [Mytilinidion resinicola]KAF2809318.1 hypothetical protein BDZ99DRAFT_531435 [Mytilinidion resinicola]
MPAGGNWRRWTRKEECEVEGFCWRGGQRVRAKRRQEARARRHASDGPGLNAAGSPPGLWRVQIAIDGGPCYWQIATGLAAGWGVGTGELSRWGHSLDVEGRRGPLGRRCVAGRSWRAGRMHAGTLDAGRWTLDAGRRPATTARDDGLRRRPPTTASIDGWARWSGCFCGVEGIVLTCASPDFTGWPATRPLLLTGVRPHTSPAPARTARPQIAGLAAMLKGSVSSCPLRNAGRRSGGSSQEPTSEEIRGRDASSALWFHHNAIGAGAAHATQNPPVPHRSQRPGPRLAQSARMAFVAVVCSTPGRPLPPRPPADAQFPRSGLLLLQPRRDNLAYRRRRRHLSLVTHGRRGARCAAVAGRQSTRPLVGRPPARLQLHQLHQHSAPRHG